MLFGTRGEKWIAWTILAGNLLTMLFERAFNENFAGVLLGYLALDAALAVILCRSP